MSALSMMYRWTSHPPDATWNMEVSRTLVVPDSIIRGRKIIYENRVFRNNTGTTAFADSDCFLKES